MLTAYSWVDTIPLTERLREREPHPPDHTCLKWDFHHNELGARERRNKMSLKWYRFLLFLPKLSRFS